MHFTIIDLLILMVLIFFFYRAFSKGLIKEFITIVSILVSVYVAQKYDLAFISIPWIDSMLPFTQPVRQIVGMIVLLLITYSVLGVLFTMLLSKLYRGYGMLDNILGGILGICEGILVVVLIFVIVDVFLGSDPAPKPLKQSFFRHTTAGLERMVYKHFLKKNHAQIDIAKNKVKIK